jgi:hypothetical protein
VPVDEVEDFASHVKLKLIEDEYAVIRAYDGRSTFAAFVMVVVHRMLIDYRISQWGKWHASTQARKLGEAAIAVEAMVVREGRSIDEIVPAMERRWPALRRRDIEEIVGALPARSRRPRRVDIELAADVAGSAWSAIALRRLRSLPSGDRAVWNTAAQQIEKVSSNDLARLIDSSPEFARLNAKGPLLLMWANAFVAGDTAAARLRLEKVRLIAQAIRKRSGEALLSDALAAVAVPSDVTEAAKGHLAYAAGHLAYANDDLTIAERELGVAVKHFSRANSPMALLAQSYIAAVLFDRNEVDEAERIVRTLLATARGRAHSTRP